MKFYSVLSCCFYFVRVFSAYIRTGWSFISHVIYFPSHIFPKKNQKNSHISQKIWEICELGNMWLPRSHISQVTYFPNFPKKQVPRYHTEVPDCCWAEKLQKAPHKSRVGKTVEDVVALPREAAQTAENASTSILIAFGFIFVVYAPGY